jgi:ABC-type Fe3+-siderophore transport system permease subunit
MTPTLLILCGLATSFVCAAAICILILIERRRARHRAHLQDLFQPMAHNWRHRK